MHLLYAGSYPQSWHVQIVTPWVSSSVMQVSLKVFEHACDFSRDCWPSNKASTSQLLCSFG